MTGKLTADTLIFDLGGVIIDLNVEASIEAMASVTGLAFHEMESLYNGPGFFQQYEKGQIADSGFRAYIRGLTTKEITDEQIDLAWNAMLLGIPAARIKLIQSLRPNYQLIVLSNTNGIHVRCFNQMLKKVTRKDSLNEFFHKVYFSHEIKMRKPDPDIYRFVLSDCQLKPQETLFLDDNVNNLSAADKLGIQTIHIDKPDRLFDIFSQWMK